MRKLFAALLASVALGLAGGAVADDKPEAPHPTGPARLGMDLRRLPALEA